MVTGASTANMAIVLIDARHGVLEQTLRHSFIASLLKIPHVTVCINKMDLVDYKEEVYDKIKKDFNSFSDKLYIKDVRFVPISALNGDNVVDRSEKMDWYDGPTLLHILENLHIANDLNMIDSRFPVQYVIRPQKTEFHDYRGYSGRIASGKYKQGDDVTVLPSGFTSKIKSIDMMGESLDVAFAPQSVTMTLEDNIDISRGDMIVKSNNLPEKSQDIILDICWFNERPMRVGGKYAIKHISSDLRCMVKEVKYKMDINTLERNYDDKEIEMNDIARVQIRTTKSLFYDSYRKNRITGSVVLIEETTNETVAAGMIV